MNLEALKNEAIELVESNKYEKATNLIANNLGIKLKVLSFGSGKHFVTDKELRFIFKMKLSKGKKSYTFKFGQSIAKGQEEPTMYDVLSCLQKYDVGSFENFCSEFGYYEYSRAEERIYKAVLKEYEAMERLFSSEELEVLQEIN